MKDMLVLYRMAHKSVNRKCSLCLLGTFSSKPVETGISQLRAVFLIRLLEFPIPTVFVNSVSNEKICNVIECKFY